MQDYFNVFTITFQRVIRLLAITVEQKYFNMPQTVGIFVQRETSGGIFI